MIEPTESETKETLDAFCDAMLKIAAEAETQPELLRDAPARRPHPPPRRSDGGAEAGAAVVIRPMRLRIDARRTDAAAA